MLIDLIFAHSDTAYDVYLGKFEKAWESEQHSLTCQETINSQGLLNANLSRSGLHSNFQIHSLHIPSLFFLPGPCPWKPAV